MWPGLKINVSEANNSVRTSFEQCLIAKMFLKTAFEQTDLTRVWGISQQYVSKIVLKWCPRWGKKARLHVRLQSLPLAFIKASQPEGFDTRYHTMPSTEVDGKDIRCEQIRKDNLGKRLVRSNKYKMAALRCTRTTTHAQQATRHTHMSPHSHVCRWISWTMPVTGLTTLVTDLFAARVSEVELVKIHKQWLIIFPPNTSRLVDRGFAFCTIYYPNLNLAFVPAFMRGRSQMFPIEIKNARRMSQDRYTCEALFSRTSLHKLMKGILKYDHLRYATDAAHCGHFSAQLMEPLMQPAKWQEFVDERCDDASYPAPLELDPRVLIGSHTGSHEEMVVAATTVTGDGDDGESDGDGDSESGGDGDGEVEDSPNDNESDDDCFIFT